VSDRLSGERVPGSIVVRAVDDALGMQQVRVRYLVATMGARGRFIAHNRRLLPRLEAFRSTNGMNVSEVHAFFEARPQLRFYKLFTWTYGMLASWTTKYRALEDQVQRGVPFQAIIEDDLLLEEGFTRFVEGMTARWLGSANERLPEADRFNLVVLGRWGEGYVTSLESARRVLAFLDGNGVRKNADIQWNDGSCGRIVQVEPQATPWRLLVKTSQGVMRQTAPINKRHAQPSLRYRPGTGMLRCHNYMPAATCAWAVEHRLCADRRWNATHCPTRCGHAVCVDQWKMAAHRAGWKTHAAPVRSSQIQPDPARSSQIQPDPVRSS